jgi:hypothetical protein
MSVGKQLIKPAALASVLLLLQADGAMAAESPIAAAAAKPATVAAAAADSSGAAPMSAPAKLAAAAGKPATLDAARFTADGKLLKPKDLEQWVFVGSSLGMGYNEAQFNLARPGAFQVVQIEPQAFRHFMETGHFAPGSMLLLSFYGADTRVSINKTGYVPKDLLGFEIHLIDPARKPDGRDFFGFRPNDAEGRPQPPGNECVRCHVEHGAFEGTFAQFYPTIRGRIPKEALEKANADHDIR